MTAETIVLDDNKKKVMAIHHTNWLNDPTTKASEQVLDAQIKRVEEYLSSKSMDKDVSDATIRHYAVQLKTLKTIKKLLYDTTTFVA
jgi:hypothetical protein